MANTEVKNATSLADVMKAIGFCTTCGHKHGKAKCLENVLYRGIMPCGCEVIVVNG